MYSIWIQKIRKYSTSCLLTYKLRIRVSCTGPYEDRTTCLYTSLSQYESIENLLKFSKGLCYVFCISLYEIGVRSCFLIQASKQSGGIFHPTKAKLKSTPQKTKLCIALKACTGYLTAVLLVELRCFAAPLPSKRERLLLLGKEPIHQDSQLFIRA